MNPNSDHLVSSSEQGPETHTPGPWRCIAASHGYVIEADCYDVAVVRNIGNHNNAANARLIAAAPELLEALREMADWLDDGNRQLSDAAAADVAKARAAIAKAQGGAE